MGPSLAGFLVGAGFTIGQLFYFAAALMLLGVATGLLLAPLYRRQVTDLLGVTDGPPSTLDSVCVLNSQSSDFISRTII
jgi:hypothetical protein